MNDCLILPMVISLLLLMAALADETSGSYGCLHIVFLQTAIHIEPHAVWQIVDGVFAPIAYLLPAALRT